jgi:hypothetical protein
VCSHRYKELSRRNLAALDLKGSRLSIDFHLTDLLGLGDIQRMDTASGTFFKLNTKESSSKGRGC